MDSGLRLGAEPPPPEEAAPVRPRSVSYAASLEQDKELQAIFERTYGKVERGAFRPQPKPARTSLDDRKYSIQAQKKGPEYLLADGYNLQGAPQRPGRDEVPQHLRGLHQGGRDGGHLH